MQEELGRPVPLIGFCGQIASGDITLPDISGPFVGKRVAVYHQVAHGHHWIAVPRHNVSFHDTPTVTPVRQLHLYRLPDKDRENQDLADTTCLQDDQWRTVPKAVNKVLKSLSHSWPSRTDAYPTLDERKRNRNGLQKDQRTKKDQDDKHQ